VARSRPADESFGGLLGVDLPRVHHRRPVLPILVLNSEHDGRAEGAAVAQPSGHLDRIFFDPLAAAASEAVLTPLEPAVDPAAIDLEAGWQALEDCGQAGPVGLAARKETEFSHASVIRGPASQS
jgi:hypothetical protein